MRAAASLILFFLYGIVRSNVKNIPTQEKKTRANTRISRAQKIGNRDCARTTQKGAKETRRIAPEC